MDLIKLKYFYVIAKYQHVTKASEELHISQPSLTQAMRLLEEDLGVKLFRKSGRSIVLTECGEYLKGRLSALLPEFDGLKQELCAIKQKVNKTVKLNILAASFFIIDAIIEYRKINPDVIFEFEQSTLKTDCDIVIATNGISTKKTNNLIDKIVKEERIFLAVPKSSAYANNDGISLADLKNENFIMFSNSRLFGVICNKFCLQAGFTPKIIFESDSPSAVQNIISLGTGVAFWPEISWGKINNENIIKVPILSPDCKRDIIVELFNVGNKLNNNSYASGFFNYLKEKLLYL